MPALFVRLLVVACLFVLASPPNHAKAQQPSQASSNQTLKPEELDQLLAPIALYPDNLLSQILIASTYPLEVVEADRWVAANKNLQGQALKDAANKQSWDDSLKALTAVPSVLSQMSSKLDWTKKLGDAVLAQQADVMDSVQRLRAKADQQKNLASTKEQKVTKTTQENKQVIVIEQTNPSVMYVPYYQPATVYGAWPYPAYPPYYWPTPPGYILGSALWFGAGFALGAWAGSGGWWGGSFNWGNNNININNDIDINRNKKWEHNVDHRKGVRYNNDQVRQKFSKDGAKADNRMDFRGKDGKQVLRPDQGRNDLAKDLGKGGLDKGGLGDKGGIGQKGGLGDKGGIGQKGGVGDKGGIGQKGAAGKGGPANNRPQVGNHPSSGRGPGSNSALNNPGGGQKAARAASDRGRASVGHGGGGRPSAGHGGGGRPSGGGGRGGGGRGGGGRR